MEGQGGAVQKDLGSDSLFMKLWANHFLFLCLSFPPVELWGLGGVE